MKTPQIPAMRGMTPLGIKPSDAQGTLSEAIRKSKEAVAFFANGSCTTGSDTSRRNLVLSRCRTNQMRETRTTNKGRENQMNDQLPVADPIFLPVTLEIGQRSLAWLVVRGFLGTIQRACLRDALKGEEGEYFAQLIVDLRKRVESMPHTYQTDGQGENATAWLHYFAGGQANWYIVEKDKGSPDDEAEGIPPQSQAFGLADLYNDGGETGYISIAEILANRGELDLYWKPTTLKEIKEARQ